MTGTRRGSQLVMMRAANCSEMRVTNILYNFGAKFQSHFFSTLMPTRSIIMSAPTEAPAPTTAVWDRSCCLDGG